MSGVLPSEILSRKKQGFAVPVAEWFRGELKGFAGEVLFRNGDGLLNGAFIERCWRQHQAGERDWSSLLWSVLMFRTWQEVSRPV